MYISCWTVSIVWGISEVHDILRAGYFTGNKVLFISTCFDELYCDELNLTCNINTEQYGLLGCYAAFLGSFRRFEAS